MHKIGNVTLNSELNRCGDNNVKRFVAINNFFCGKGK